jgi:hypothetical protein
MPKVTISACVELDVAEQLVGEAKRCGLSLSGALNRILQAHFSEKAQKPRSGRTATVTQNDQAQD